MGNIEPDPLKMTLYPNATCGCNITEDPMVKEFIASLIAWSFLEHLLSPSVPLQL